MVVYKNHRTYLVGVGRLELPASWSRTKRATNCATPRNSFYIIIKRLQIKSSSFWIYRQRNKLNLFILTAKYVLAKRKQSFVVSPALFLYFCHI